MLEQGFHDGPSYLMVPIMKTVAILMLVAACGEAAPPQPPVSRAWPVLGTMMSAAAWGRDTAQIGRALAAARDTADRPGPVALDSLRGEVRRETGITLTADDIKEGDALDRAALVLAGVTDSALLDLGGHFVWIGPRATRRPVGIADPASSLTHLATVEMQSGSLTTAARVANDTSISVTVLAPSAAAAEGWATGLLGVGCDSALALAPRLALWRASIVCADSGGSRVRWTRDLEGRVVVPHKPYTPRP